MAAGECNSAGAAAPLAHGCPSGQGSKAPHGSRADGKANQQTVPVLLLEVVHAWRGHQVPECLMLEPEPKPVEGDCTWKQADAADCCRKQHLDSQLLHDSGVAGVSWAGARDW